MRKLGNSRGMTRATALILVAIAVLLALLAVPAVRRYRARAERSACALALASAQRKVDTASAGGAITAQEAKRVATQDVIAWEELCPSGGNCYLVEDGDGTYTIFCALHGDDKKLCTRLNAAHALEELERELKARRLLGEVPERAALVVNGSVVTAERAAEEPDITRGTKSTPGYKGTVARYVADEAGLHSFTYADEHHCAIWRDGEGWTGDSWS